jgi:hypothetical protein
MPPVDRPSSGADLRRAPRYPMEAPVEFAGGTGVTRDLSTSGVYFTCDQPMRVGARLSLAIMLDDTMADTQLRTEYEGTIVRVDEKDGKMGIAVRIDRLRRPQMLQ